MDDDLGRWPRLGWLRAFGPQQGAESKSPCRPLEEQRRIVAELDAEAVQIEAVHSLLPRFEAKIQRILDRVWGNGENP